MIDGSGSVWSVEGDERRAMLTHIRQRTGYDGDNHTSLDRCTPGFIMDMKLNKIAQSKSGGGYGKGVMPTDRSGRRTIEETHWHPFLAPKMLLAWRYVQRTAGDTDGAYDKIMSVTGT